MPKLETEIFVFEFGPRDDIVLTDKQEQTIKQIVGQDAVNFKLDYLIKMQENAPLNDRLADMFYDHPTTQFN